MDKNGCMGTGIPSHSEKPGARQQCGVRRDYRNRFNHLQSASTCGRWKRGAENNALGRSRGGLGTKIHALVDGKGIPLRLMLTPGQVNDAPVASALLAGLDLKDVYVLGDKGYDSRKIVDLVEEQEGTVVIPSRSNSTRPRIHDKQLYKLRNVVERFFNRIKQFRRIATRYEKSASSFLAILHIAATLISINCF